MHAGLRAFVFVATIASAVSAMAQLPTVVAGYTEGLSAEVACRAGGGRWSRSPSGGICTRTPIALGGVDAPSSVTVCADGVSPCAILLLSSGPEHTARAWTAWLRALRSDYGAPTMSSTGHSDCPRLFVADPTPGNARCFLAHGDATLDAWWQVAGSVARLRVSTTRDGDVAVTYLHLLRRSVGPPSRTWR